MHTALTVLMTLLSGSIFLSYLNKPYWYVRVFDFPLQFNTLLLSLCSGIFPWVNKKMWPRDILLLCSSGLAIGLGASKLYRYTRLAPCKLLPPAYDDTERQVSILSANVRQKNRCIRKFRQLAERVDADIIALYETDGWWAEQTAFLKEKYPYQVLVPQENTYGMLLYSRLRLAEHSVNNFCIENVPSIHAVVELRNGQRFELYTLHPKPPRLYQSTSARDSEIVRVGQKIRQTKTPTVLAGDLNDVPWSKALTLFSKMSNTLDPRQGRGLYNTFNAHIPFCRYPLDFIHFNSEFRVVEFCREQKIGSDHFPLYIRLSLEPENSNADNAYTLDGEARRDAEEIIQQENRSIFPEFPIWSDR